jgi:predicted amidohydrolase YtcJ
MMLKGHEFAIKKLGIPGTNKRTVIVHSQIMRPDQLEKYKEYGLLPSFFTNHTFFWGDIHENNLGEERASFISPMKSAMNMGIKCTNHSDYMVTPMDPLFLIWTSVNRITRSGKILGPDERITPYQAIQAITINAAYEYYEEDSKGTLSAGKLADMVILNSNPLKIDPMIIKDIVLLETIKEGTTIYKK